MRDPANWSTNEIEQRYSAELLKEVKKWTLTYEGEVLRQLDARAKVHVPNPITFRYISFQNFSLCFEGAGQVRENMTAPTAPFIEEDIPFLRFGRAVRHMTVFREYRESEDGKVTLLIAVPVVAVAVAALIWGNPTHPLAVLLFGGIFFLGWRGI